MTQNRLPTKITRRGARALALLGVCLASAAAQPTPLKTLAKAHGIDIGVAVSFPGGGGRAAYDSLIVRNFTGIVAENDHKWGSISSQPGQYNWVNSDRMVDFAQQHGLNLRFHAFVWHQQSSYIANGHQNNVAQPTDPNKYTREEAFTHMRNHIGAVMGRYKERGQMHVFVEWDVVNEAVARDSAGMRLSTGKDSLLSRWVGYTKGEDNDFDYIDSAFVIAHRVDSTAVLAYNDYDAEHMGVKGNLVYNLLSKLKSRNIPVHVLGMQSHFHMNQPGTYSSGAWDPQQFVQNMNRVAALGLDISITELDVRMPLPADSAQLEQQREAYEQILSMCLAQPRCKRFYVWGVRDGQSWINNRYPGWGAPLLFTGSGTTYTPKPAYHGLISVLETTPVALRGRSEFPGARNRTRALIHNDREPVRDLLGRRMPSLPDGRASFGAQKTRAPQDEAR